MAPRGSCCSPSWPENVPPLFDVGRFGDVLRIRSLAGSIIDTLESSLRPLEPRNLALGRVVEFCHNPSYRERRHLDWRGLRYGQTHAGRYRTVALDPVTRWWASDGHCDRSGNQLKKSGSPFVVGGSPFDQAVGPLYAKNERTPGPVDHDLHAGRRLRHDRLGAYGHSANESVPLAGGGRHKITSVR
jgi:hypothetical protein